MTKRKTEYTSKSGVLTISCIFGVMFLFFVFLMFGIFSPDTAKFSGCQEFSTIEDAQEYQSEILNTALAYNAEVESCDISFGSPTTLSWRVALPESHNAFLPQETEFPYGQVVTTRTQAWIGIGVVDLFCVALYGGTIFWAIKDYRKGIKLQLKNGGKAQ